MNEVFLILKSAGLRSEDITHIEYMTNPAILRLAEINTEEEDYYTKRKNVILYFKAWLHILEGKENPQNLQFDNKQALEANLLKAVAEERYEDAAKIQGQLVSA